MRRLGLVLVLVWVANASRAQDAHLSLYDAAPLFLNPAMTGVMEGNWRLHGQYRTQWKSVNFKPYNSALISFDMPYKKWGFGVQLSNFRAGIGNYNALQGTISVAYSTAMDKRKRHHIAFGVQGGVVQKSLEYQLLSYNNQYSTNNGGEFDMNIDALEDFEGQSLVTEVVNAGLLYFNAKQEAKLNPFFGISVFNLTEPQESFNQEDNRLAMRFYGHAGTRINFTELFYVLPKVLVMNQQDYWEQTYALDLGYYLKGSDMYLTAGALFRTVGWPGNTSAASIMASDAVLVAVGAKMENIVLKVGYDINISSLSTVSNGRGGFEVSLTYIHRKDKSKSERICPRL